MAISSGVSGIAAREPIRVGVLVPHSGPAGIWGPSCRANAELAASEFNETATANRQIELVYQDAGQTPQSVAKKTACLLADNAIDAIVGMHTSDIRDAVAAVVGARVPYVYTPLHEGSPPENTICIGPTPERQLLPALDWLCDRYKLRRWYFVGNDYVWPRTTHRMAARQLSRQGAIVVGTDYLQFSSGASSLNRYDDIISRIRTAKPDIVLLSLIGQDSVMFNRAFHKSGLGNTVLRFSCAIEENMLMAIGAGATEGIFVSSNYFATLDTKRNGAFRERYHSRFSERAPVLNDLGQSVYEGMTWLTRHIPGGQTAANSARFESDMPGDCAIYVAEAADYGFNIVSRVCR